jgi:hypothetical protein
MAHVSITFAQAAPTFINLTATQLAMGQDCSANCAGRIMDDPTTALDVGGLTYDEQPAHLVNLEAYALFADTISQATYAASGLPGDATDASHDMADAFAAWYTTQQADGYVYRVPTEAEWENAALSAPSGLSIGVAREHVSDWHGLYAAGTVDAPAGPRTGVLRVAKGGNATRRTARFTVATGQTNATSGAGCVTFRLARSAVPGAVPRPAAPPPLPQVAVLPTALATDADSGATIDVAGLGPPAGTPLFDVRMVMPIPPDSETDGMATLAGLSAATMFHNHSPGLEVMANGDVLAVWFSSAGGSGEKPAPTEPGKESSINTRMVQARLRHGADRWDTPELLYDFKHAPAIAEPALSCSQSSVGEDIDAAAPRHRYANDQSALLWTEGKRTWLWGGGGKPWGIGSENDQAPAICRTRPAARLPRRARIGLCMGESVRLCRDRCRSRSRTRTTLAARGGCICRR